MLGDKHSALWVSYQKFVLKWRTLSTSLISACTAENLMNAGRDGRWKKDKNGGAGGSSLHWLLVPRVPSLLLKRNLTLCICLSDWDAWPWKRPCRERERCPGPEGWRGRWLPAGARAVSRSTAVNPKLKLPLQTFIADAITQYVIRQEFLVNVMLYCSLLLGSICWCKLYFFDKVPFYRKSIWAKGWELNTVWGRYDLFFSIHYWF